MNKLKMIIIAVFQWLKCYRLGDRIKLQFKAKKDCRHSCLVCEFFDECITECKYVSVEHKGYTICQNTFNYHTMIFDKKGKNVFHAQGSQLLSEDELREQIEFCLRLWQDKEAKK